MEIVNRDRSGRHPDRLGNRGSEPQRLCAARADSRCDRRPRSARRDRHDAPRLRLRHGVVRALCAEVGLDDLIVAKKCKAGEAKVKVAMSLGMRWPVERTNSWLSNFGQLRRNTDRFIHRHLDSIALAIALSQQTGGRPRSRESGPRSVDSSDSSTSQSTATPGSTRRPVDWYFTASSREGGVRK